MYRLPERIVVSGRSASVCGFILRTTGMAIRGILPLMGHHCIQRQTSANVVKTARFERCP
jgi:hypothetical protein